MNNIIEHYLTLPFLEVIAVIASLAYVILAARKNIWCWPAAFISTALYVFLFYKFYLWMDSLLQVYYMGMAFYGWYCWYKPKQPSHSKTLLLKTLPIKVHFLAVLVLSGISGVVGFLMSQYTPTDFPYLDSTTTVFAVFATYLVTQKVVENWLYWIVINFVSIHLYVQKGLVPTAFLFCVFIIVAVYGYVMWRREYQNYDISEPRLT